jgi:hypothetical protein
VRHAVVEHPHPGPRRGRRLAATRYPLR